MVWRDVLAENRQRRIAVRTVMEIAKDLIEGAVFLDDVNNVFDVRAMKFITSRSPAVSRVEVVGCNNRVRC